MKALVGAFNQEKALVGAFSVIVQPVVEPMEHYTALVQCLLLFVVVMPPSIVPRKLDHLYSYKLLGPSCGLGWAVVRKFESPCLHSLHSLVVSCPDTSRD